MKKKVWDYIFYFSGGLKSELLGCSNYIDPEELTMKNWAIITVNNSKSAKWFINMNQVSKFDVIEREVEE